MYVSLNSVVSWWLIAFPASGWRRSVVNWTGTNFSEIVIKIWRLFFLKTPLKISSVRISSIQIQVGSSDATITSLQTILGVPAPPSSSSSRRRRQTTTQATGQLERVVAGGAFRAVGTANLTASKFSGVSWYWFWINSRWKSFIDIEWTTSWGWWVGVSKT